MGLGPGGVEPAIVPEAAVDEDGESACAENEGCLYAKDFPFRAVGRPPERSARRQPVMPWARKTVMSRSSVAALPRERMADMTAERFRLVKMSATARSVRRGGALTTDYLWKTYRYAHAVVSRHRAAVPPPAAAG